MGLGDLVIGILRRFNGAVELGIIRLFGSCFGMSTLLSGFTFFWGVSCIFLVEGGPESGTSP